MKLGIKETQRFFSNADFKWFERKEVRNQENLSQEDLKYIKGWTISPFGYGFLFYLAERKLPDLLTVYVTTFIYFEVIDKFPKQHDFNFLNDVLTITLAVTVIIMLIAWVYSLYFMYRHGRRLSWNRGRYVYRKYPFGRKLKEFESVQELRKSEGNFIKWNVIPSIIFGVGILFVVFMMHLFS